jgi:hypothetical protein
MTAMSPPEPDPDASREQEEAEPETSIVKTYRANYWKRNW